jgi:hypothetical protein
MEEYFDARGFDLQRYLTNHTINEAFDLVTLPLEIEESGPIPLRKFNDEGLLDLAEEAREQEEIQYAINRKTWYDDGEEGAFDPYRPEFDTLQTLRKLNENIHLEIVRRGL